MSDSALHPTNSFAEFASIGESVEETVDNTEDQEIAEMAKSTGWKHIETLINTIQSDLDNLMTQAIQAGYNYEEIGRKTIVREVTRGAIDRIIQRVRNAQESTAK